MGAKTKDREKLPRAVKCREQCRHPLSVEEMVDAGKELAEAQREASQLEEDFKSVRDEWKARISATEARSAALAGRISRGYDTRETECDVWMDTPKDGLKTCVRLDTGATVWVREMTASDCQLPLPIDGEEGQP